MDSTEALSRNMSTYTNVRNCLKQGNLGVVARDGIEPPTPAFSGSCPQLHSGGAANLRLQQNQYFASKATASMLECLGFGS